MLKGRFNYDPKFVNLNFNTVIGKGFIKCVKHSNGIVTFNLDITANKAIEIPIGSAKLDTIQFLYLDKGLIEHTSADSALDTTIIELQTAIIVNKVNSESKFVIKKNKRTLFSLISLRKKVYTSLFDKNDGEFSIRALKFINDLNNSDKTIIAGDYDVKLAEHFKKYLTHIERDENLGFLSAEGSVYHMLSHHFQLALHSKKNSDIDTKLNYTELKKISDLGDAIKNVPEIQYSIHFLTLNSGLSPAKLQEGFKSLFNRTVSDFIRHVRLQKAEFLMSTTDLNISEIVYSIGFTSRSYFCKIFKNEYGCSPKQYKKKLKGVYVDAVNQVVS